MKGMLSFLILGLLMVKATSACLVNNQDCANGGTCRTGNNGNYCDCPDGFSGTDCQNDSPPAPSPPVDNPPVDSPPAPSPPVDSAPAPAPSDPNNPCTEENIRAKGFYHTYPADEKKYIQCDMFGRSWVKPCAPGTKWKQAILTCIHA